MSEDFSEADFSKMYFCEDFKYDEEEDDEVFVTNTTTSSTTSSEDARGIIIPSRTRRVSDVIDSFNSLSASPISPNFKRHSFAEFSISQKKTSNSNYILKESKSESAGIDKKLMNKHAMEKKLSLPSTPGSDQGYGSCLPTPNQMVYKPPTVFRYSSSSMYESHQTITQMDGPTYLPSQTDAQPSQLPKETPTQTVINHGDSQIEVPMPVARDSFEYNMNHTRRGRAIVFNHDEFKMGDMAPRPGSITDVENLKSAFYNLGFDFIVYNNLDFKDVQEILSQLSQEDHSDADCLVVTVLTHGLGERYLWAHDMPYFVENLWLPFTADKCKTLAGKPKIFFIQACRGTKLDAGVKLVSKSNTETDSAVNAYKIPSYADFLVAYSTVEDEKLSKNDLKIVESRTDDDSDNKLTHYIVPMHVPYKIPTIADFLVAYSTAEGFYSWRHPENGTWFIQCLCQELNDSGTKLDLLSIMTRVSRRVALDMESYNDLLSWQHQQKQVPSINSMLIRNVLFKPKKSS